MREDKEETGHVLLGIAEEIPTRIVVETVGSKVRPHAIRTVTATAVGAAIGATIGAGIDHEIGATGSRKKMIAVPVGETGYGTETRRSVMKLI